MTSQRLAPTPKIRAAVKAKASAVQPQANVSAVGPKAKAPAVDPKAKASAVDPKAKVSAAPKTPPKAAGPGLTDEPVVDLPRSLLLYNPDTFGRCNFRVEDSQGIDGKIVIYDFHKSPRELDGVRHNIAYLILTTPLNFSPTFSHI